MHYRKWEMFRGGKVSRFSRIAMQSRNFYAGYCVKMALFKYFKRVTVDSYGEKAFNCQQKTVRFLESYLHL